MHVFDKDFREIWYSQIVSLVGGLIAGTLLVTFTDKLFLLPGMLVLLPGFLEMRGNISGAFASRLSSGLFLGVVSSKQFHSRIVRGNLAASFLLAIIISLFLGLLAFAFTALVLHVLVYRIILVALIAGVLANALEIPLTLYATFYLYNKGHDPNNIMGPFVTSTGDIIGVIALLIALVIV